MGQVVGSALVALGISVTLVTDIGAGALDVLNLGLADTLGIPLSFAVWIVAGTMIAVAAVLGGRPRLGTFVTPLVVGAALQPLVDLHRRVLPDLSLATAIPVHLVGIVLIGLGAGAIVVAGFGAGTGELLTDAVATRLRRSPPLMRVSIEVSWACAGLALGGPAGVGTVLAASSIGSAVELGIRVARPLMTAPPAPGSPPPDPPTLSGRRPGSLSRFHRRRGAHEEVRVLVRR